MNTTRLLAVPQQLLSFALAALTTAALLLSLGAQADGQHADAMAQVGQNAKLCGVQASAARS